MKYSKFIVALVILLNLFAFIAILYVYDRRGTEPTVLTTAWFGFTTGELWLLSKIKRSKSENGGSKDGKDQLETEINES